MTALLLLPDPTAVAAAAELAAVLERVRGELPGVAVSGRLDELRAAGHTEVVVVALVPGGGGYDPAVLELALAQQAAGVQVRSARPLGPHPLLVELAAARVHQALGDDRPAELAVLVVGPGSPDPEGNAEVAKVARLLQEGRALGPVEHAFLRGTTPDVAAGLARCAALGARAVVVLPHVLLDAAFTREVTAAAVAPDGVVVRVAAHLGDSPELAALVVERYHEALHGELRMNCDVCTHRELQPHGHRHGHGHGHGHADV